MKFIPGKTLFTLSLLINLFLVLLFFGSASEGFLKIFFGSDCLYLPSLYRDLIVDHHSLKDWTLNPAPNFIPEWPIYFLFNYLAGDFRTASLLYGLFNFFAINLLIVLVYKNAFQGIPWLYLSFVNFAMSTFIILFLRDSEYILSGLIFLSAFHNGAFIMTLLIFWLFLKYLRSGRGYLIPGIILGLSLLGILSDRLFLVFCTIPMLTTLTLWKERQLRPKLILSICWASAGAFAGLLFFDLLEKWELMTFNSISDLLLNFRKVFESLHLFSQQLQIYIQRGGFTRLIVLGSAASLFTGMILSIRLIFSKKSRLLPLAKVGIILLTSFILLVLLNPIVNGSYLDITGIRYNIYSFYIALSLISVFFFYLSNNRKIFLYLFNGAAIVIPAVILIYALSFEVQKKALANISKVQDYYPGIAAKVDSLSVLYNLKCGISQYQKAKVVTMFSKENVNVRHVYWDLSPYLHVTNIRWYIGEKSENGQSSPIFDFIISGDGIDSSISNYFNGRIDTIYPGDPIILKVPDFYYSSPSPRMFDLNIH
ncbi:MAG: hypothetical protein KQI35_06280 [Bacteroidetes bacterium]|nr:hypothetical protein [Bacteroidota bacterium]